MTPDSADDRVASASTLYFEKVLHGPDTLEIGSGVAAVLSMRCPERESPNEDAAAIVSVSEAACVLVVADGMGGNAQGEKASRAAIEAIRAAVEAAASEGILLRTAIINGIEDANLAVQKLGSGAGTTLAAVEIANGTLRPYHVGDTMVLVTGGRGRIKLQTVAHSPVGYAVEAGVLNAEEAMHHEERHLVSNFVGTPEMRIDVGPPLRLAPRDTVILASDGLFDNLHLAEIVQFVRSGPLGEAVAKLKDVCVQRMTSPSGDHPAKPDDLTVIAYRPT